MSAAVQSIGQAAPAAAGWPLRQLVRLGVIGGVIAVYLCLVGIVPAFSERALIAGVVTIGSMTVTVDLSIGQVSLLMTYAVFGYLAGRPLVQRSRAMAAGAGVFVGALTGTFLTGLVLLGSVVDLRAVFLNASPDLYNLLTSGLGTSGAWVPIVTGAVTGGLAGILVGLPVGARNPLLVGLGSLILFSLFGGLIRTPMLVTPLAGVARFLFGSDGLTVAGAIIVFFGSVGIALLDRRVKPRQRVNAMPPTKRRAFVAPVVILLLVVVLLFPLAAGDFFAQVIATIALFILLGLGLNITLGLAGLLDLGFVAFYAVGAYTVALLTSDSVLGLAHLGFWEAVPFAIIFAMLFGLLLGLPILRIRGDYLAIATLGFGEIIRLLAGSDLLKGILGGPQGIVNIPKPIPVGPNHWLAGPVQIYYIALAFAAVVAFVSWRLRASRLGRSWMAIREDEDVAEGMGINLVQTKLLAYMLGGGFAGLAGAISVGLVGSVFPTSVQLQLSINVVAIVIVGGMGSIPGVILGAVVLVGLPEMFREFSDYRLLFYGIALMAVMIYRPEGLLPSRVARRELHTADELLDMDEADLLSPEELATPEGEEGSTA